MNQRQKAAIADGLPVFPAEVEELAEALRHALENVPGHLLVPFVRGFVRDFVHGGGRARGDNTPEFRRALVEAAAREGEQLATDPTDR